MRAVRKVAAGVAFAMLAASSWVTIAPPAYAADAGVDKLVATLDGATNSLQSWTHDLATVGKLADALPAVQTSAGSVLGFTDLLDKWFTSGTHKLHAGDATTYGDLDFAAETITLGDGRTGTLESHLTDVGGDKHVTVTITASNTVHDQALSIPVSIGSNSNEPQSAFSSTGGVDLTVSATLVFELVWDHLADNVYLVANGSTPSMHFDAAAHLGTLTDIHAAVGILGVSVVAPSTLDLSAHFVASFSDPNNDGKLAFDNSSSELAQAGSLAGLVTIGFATPAGALDAHLVLNAAATTSSIPLPAVNATIDVSWPDISSGSPTVTPTGIDVAGKFLNLTPRDLADGIAQLATTLTEIQSSKIGAGGVLDQNGLLGNLDLPFIKGSLADAIQLNEAIKKFLKDNTIDAATDPAQAGHPTFVSLQEMLDRLNTATGLPGGGTIGVSGVQWDDTSSKLNFTLTLRRDPPSTGEDLSAAAAAASGGPNTTYTATTLTDSSPGHQPWATDEFAGHHVVAGTSGGTIASNTADTLTLLVPDPINHPGEAWTPSVPDPDSPYVISGGQGDLGTVQLGNGLQSSGHGIANANAVNATAKVKPSYEATITLVLDLEPPTLHDPPLVQDNGDGTTTLVSATPTAANRILLRTTNSPTLFTADMPIDASVDLFANAGFLQVELSGNAHVCNSQGTNTDCTGSPTGHMLEVDLKDNGDMTFGDVVQKLISTPGDLLDFHVHVRGAGSVNVSVPQAASFLPSPATASFHWNDLTQLTGPDGPQFDVSGLSDIINVDFDPSNPKQLFAIILKTLQTLDKAIGDSDPSGGGIFNTQIPVIGRSLRDLLRSDESGMGSQVTFGSDFLEDDSRSSGNSPPNPFPQSLVGRSVVVGTQVQLIKTVTDNKLTMASPWTTQPTPGTPYVVRSELDDVISILENAPSDNLQALIKVLNDRLAHNTPVSFAYEDDAKVNNVASLVIKLDWKRSFHTSAPVQLNFDLPSLAGQKLAGVEGQGLVSLGAGGEIQLGLVVPLAPGDGPADASQLQILNDSHIGANLDASLEGSLAIAIGPLSLALGDPTSSDKAKAKASYSIDLAKSGGDGTAEDFATFLGEVAPDINASSNDVDCGLPDAQNPTGLALCADLPLYINTGSGYTKLVGTSTGFPCDPNCSDAFTIRLPKSGTSFTDYFDLSSTAPQIDGHDRLETPQPDVLANEILTHLIDLSRIDGIDGLLNLLVTSLNTASFGGKLPLIGDDLQQGADFIGNLKTAIDNALGSLGGVSSISGLRDWVNNQLETQLTNAGLNPDLVKVDTLCSSTLDSVGAPTVTPSDATGSHTFTYAIVSYVTDSSGNQSDAQPGPDGSTNVANFTTVDATHFNTVTWSAVTNANGYKVYRDDGAGLKLLKDVGTATTYKDDGTDSPTDPPTNPSGPNPKKHDCDFSEFDSVLIRLDVSQGEFSGDVLNCPAASDPHHCLEESVPLDIGIPGLSLRAADPSQGPGVQIGWRLHLAFGISRSEGFFVDTKDGDPQPEFAVGLNFTLPSAMQAQLAFVNITADNCVKTDTVNCDSDAPAPGSVPSLFSGSFKIDLKAPNDPTSGHLTLSDLSSASLDDLFSIELNAGVHIDWLLKAKVGGGDAGFPGIQTELRLNWTWSHAFVGENDGNNGTPLSIQFLKVQIDAGEIFSHILGPIVNEIKTVTGPLDPVIKTLYAPIPVLSDLSHLVGGDDVTIISIAKAFSTIAGGPDLSFVDTMAAVVNFINHIPTCSTSCLIPIGSFSVLGDKALDTPATPSNSDSLIDQSSKKDKNGGTAFPSALSDLDSANSSPDPSNSLSGGSSSGGAKAGFTFPVFEHPASLFNLIMGGDVDLVKFDSGPLTLGFDWRQEFGPVYAPPPVLITLHGSASVSLRIVAGFDTFGIRKAFEAARAGTLDLGTVGEAFLQSLFFYTVDDKGKPIPVVSFHGEIAAGAEVSAVIIKVGIEGGVGLTVSFLWNDPDNDGKFRISEFLQAALNNPICLFTVSGKITVFLKLFVTIGFEPFAVSFDFTIVDVTLLDFSAAPDCTPPPPHLAGLTGDGQTLVVYAAALGHGQRGDSAWDSNNSDKDTVKITSLHDYTVDPPAFRGIAVDMLGIRREFLNTSIVRVVVLGRGPGLTTYDKPMSVTFMGDGKADTAKTGGKPPTASFDKDAIVFGGSNKDNIKTGIGNSWVDGSGNDDTIVTGDRTVLNGTADAYILPGSNAHVAGDGGNDSISVGNGDDTVWGDGSLKLTTTPIQLHELNDGVDGGDPLSGDGHAAITVGVPNVGDLDTLQSTADGSDGNDTVSVGLGQNTVNGNAGDDVLSVSADNALAASKCSPAPAACLFRSKGDTIIGGKGNDNIAGGTGNDTINTGPAGVTDIDGTGSSDDGTINVVDTGTGNDTVYGGTGEDRVTGHSTPTQVDDIRGGSGNDILVGGFGADKVYGGPDDDYVIAEPSTVDLGTGPPPDDGFGPAYVVTHLALPAGTSPSKKTLVGGLGKDHVIGGDGGADIYGDQQTTPCVAGSPVPSDPVDESVDNPLDGNDMIIGGAGVENVRAGGGDDNVDVKGNNDLVCGEKGNDTIQGGAGDDQVWGGSGDDIIFGSDGADRLYGNDGTDDVYGNDGADTIEGNGGADFLFGGAGDDAIVGGTQAVGRADDGDVIWGDSGVDILIGDNGDASGNGTPFDLDGLNATYGGSDFIFGGDGNDRAYGGLAGDYVFGGNGDDYLEGNNGSDTLNGEAGQDDIIGGSSEVVSGTGLAIVGRPDDADIISGGDGEDVVLGDNGAITRPASAPWSDFTLGRSMTPRLVTPYDWANNDATTYGGDTIHGDGSGDVILGEGGDDTISGDAGDDYIEGNQGADTVSGGLGQDDILGGSSQVANGADKTGLAATGEPDTGDTLLSGGDGEDVVLGDNGFILRTELTGASDVTGTLEDVTKGRGMTQRRINLYDVGASSPGGGDTITGGDANDALFGGVGSDTINGNLGDDYLEGDQGSDILHGDEGQDDIVGGGALVAAGTCSVATDNCQSAVGVPDAGDTITGDVGTQSTGDADVVLGDDGSILRIGASDASTISKTPDDAVKGHGGVTARRIRLYDVQDTAPAANSGPDDISGQGGDDALFGQGGTDRIKGGNLDDHIEGGQGADFIEGDAGDDDIVGGSAIVLATPGGPDTAQGVLDAGDVMYGGEGNDVITGDNAEVVRVGPASGAADAASFTTKFTNRLIPTATGIVTSRWLRRLDLSVGASQLLGDPVGRYGDDQISGGNGTDVLFGQDGNDAISGGPHDDYVEGGGGSDVIRGDRLLSDGDITNVFPPVGPPDTADRTLAETHVPAVVDPGWPGSAGPMSDLEGSPLGDPGQDDLIGGSSIQGFRDGNDSIEGDDKADFELGDNGALVRDYSGPVNGVYHYTVATNRYPTGAVPSDAVIVRHNDPTISGMTTTRFCTNDQATCEVSGAFGNDTMYGDAGDDTMWGQDGNDTMRGGSGNDDMYGELGDDTMYGDAGQDAMLGDRGGIVDTFINSPSSPGGFATPYTASIQSPPALTYNAFLDGTYDRRTDLYHDINGEAFVGSGTGDKMPHNGADEGGVDHMRGGGGHDNLHAGYGDDVVNGDSGGDTVFGDDGADVLWGGKGCDPLSSEDYDGTCTDPSSARGTNDMFVDYLFGGKGGDSVASLKGDSGADIMDWQPRGSYPGNCSPDPWPETLSADVTVDPCDWFLMTATYNDTGTSSDPSHADNQTHHGVDWMYGGWDRDVMQADQADEGPNTGDRLLDWTGAYNLYSHCNPSYGGFNDVRVLSPDELTFMQEWSYGVGIGQAATDVTTAGTSAFDELALVYQSDIKDHGNGKAFPTTPGHFDSPNACSY